MPTQFVETFYTCFRMRLVTFGGLSLEGSSFRRNKSLLLVTYLALEGARDRRYIAELFWPDAADHMKSLTVALAQLRKAAPNVIEADAARVYTRTATDAKQLLDKLEAGELKAGLELYQGAFLEGIFLPKWGNELEEWVYKTREFLAAQVREAWFKLADNALKTSHIRQASRCAEAGLLVAGAPFVEPQRLPWLYAVLLAGESLHVANVLEEAQGFDVPLVKTKAEALEQLRASYPHEPQVRGQVREAATTPFRNTSFVGRDLELTDITNVLSRQTRPLVTLVGPGGVGKTRLAMQVAKEQRKHALFETIYIAFLENLDRADAFLSCLIEALGLEADPNKALDVLVEHIGARKTLLVFDNFEHVLDASLLLSNLLQRCSSLTILVTSRERLNLEEEEVFLVQGLAYPAASLKDGVGLEEAQRYDAVSLFVDRAKQARPDFRLRDDNLADVLEICKLVEGLPLGLELAAASVKLMPCQDIVHEMQQSLEVLSTSLRNVPARQRSLYATINSSWQQLSSKEQHLFRSLSVFRGGFKREAAQQVAGATLPLLASLIDKSLLRVSPAGRYSFHPLLYQFAHAKLAAQPDELRAVQDLHGGYFIQRLHPREADLTEDVLVRYLQHIDDDWDNLRKMFQWSLSRGDDDVLLRCIDAVELCFERRGQITEGLEYLCQADARGTNNQRLQGRIWVERAWYHFKLEQYDLSQDYAQRGIAALQQLQDHWQSKGHNTLGCVAWDQSDFVAAKTHIERALEIARQHDDLLSCIALQNNLAATLQQLGDYATAVHYLQDALLLSRRLGKLHRTVFTLSGLAVIKRLQGEPQAARDMLLEALELARSIGEHGREAYLLFDLSEVFHDLGDYTQAESFADQAREQAQTIQRLTLERESLLQIARSKLKMGQVTSAQTLCYQVLALAWQAQHVLLVLTALCTLAECYSKQANVQQARMLLRVVLHHPTASKPLIDRARQMYDAFYLSSENTPIKDIKEPGGQDLSLDKVVQDVLAVAPQV
ncbi:MAG: tetratricopeptide repeat protein [Deinococcota bacterium]